MIFLNAYKLKRMKIKVKLFNPKCRLESTTKGDWIDLRSAETLHIYGPEGFPLKQGRRVVQFYSGQVNLGIAMQLPKGFEAIINPRSSTFKHWGIISANGQGVIDNSYNGSEDQWIFPFISFKEGFIKEGDRICQFRIQLNQKASVWQKLTWIFSKRIEFEYVESLSRKNRGGFGSTGMN